MEIWRSDGTGLRGGTHHQLQEDVEGWQSGALQNLDHAGADCQSRTLRHLKNS
jgi:hypothetical protein